MSFPSQPPLHAHIRATPDTAGHPPAVSGPSTPATPAAEANGPALTQLPHELLQMIGRQLPPDSYGAFMASSGPAYAALHDPVSLAALERRTVEQARAHLEDLAVAMPPAQKLDSVVGTLEFLTHSWSFLASRADTRSVAQGLLDNCLNAAIAVASARRLPETHGLDRRLTMVQSLMTLARAMPRDRDAPSIRRTRGAACLAADAMVLESEPARRSGRLAMLSAMLVSDPEMPGAVATLGKLAFQAALLPAHERRAIVAELIAEAERLPETETGHMLPFLRKLV